MGFWGTFNQNRKRRLEVSYRSDDQNRSAFTIFSIQSENVIVNQIYFVTFGTEKKLELNKTEVNSDFSMKFIFDKNKRL